jgi:hypothetical protein
METGQYIDLGIGIVQAALGVYLSWKAFIVSLKDFSPMEQKRHMAIFGVCCLAVIALAGVQTYRNFGLDRKLDKIEANTEKPQQAPTVNVAPPSVSVSPQIVMPTPAPPKEHTRATFMTPFGTGNLNEKVLPYRRDEKIEMNIGYKNAGDFTLRPVEMRPAILIVPVSELGTVFHNHRNQLLTATRIGSGALVPHVDTIAFHTEFGPTLTDDDVASLNNGSKILCAIATLKWRDDSGLYETDFSECLVAEPPAPGGGFNWHIGSETDVEHKLR